MQKYIRGMKRDEVKYFEDPRGLWYCFEFMLEQLVSQHEKAITAKSYYSFIDWSTKDTQYGNVQDLKDKTKTGKLESTLVTLHWLFDFLDFAFEDLVRAEKVPETQSESSSAPPSPLDPHAELNIENDFMHFLRLTCVVPRVT